MLGHQPATRHADRRQRIVEDLAAGDVGLPLIQQAHQRAHQAGLALTTLTEQDEVVAGEQRALELGKHGVVEPTMPGKADVPERRCCSRFARTSALTLREVQPEARSSPSVLHGGKTLSPHRHYAPVPDAAGEPARAYGEAGPPSGITPDSRKRWRSPCTRVTVGL
jgi:hypothetical protein